MTLKSHEWQMVERVAEEMYRECGRPVSLGAVVAIAFRWGVAAMVNIRDPGRG